VEGEQLRGGDAAGHLGQADLGGLVWASPMRWMCRTWARQALGDSRSMTPQAMPG